MDIPLFSIFPKKDKTPTPPLQNLINIAGASISLSAIRDFRIVQREYIYRPCYREKKSSIKRIFSSCSYEFYSTLPYAAVVTESEYKSINRKSMYVGDSAVEALNAAKDLMETASAILSGTSPADIIANSTIGAVTGLVDKIGSLVASEKYYCVFPSGRTTTTSLSAIPPILTRLDGRTFEPEKKELKTLLPNENTNAMIVNIPALMIKTNVTFLFYGNGLQLANVEQVYNQLCLLKRIT